MGYSHVGHAVVLRSSKEGGGAVIDVQRDSSEAPFEGVRPKEIIPAVGAAVVEAVTRSVPAAFVESSAGKGMTAAVVAAAEEHSALSPSELEALWETEKKAWSVLLQGTAVTEHMEEEYFAAVDAAVAAWKQTPEYGKP